MKSLAEQSAWDEGDLLKRAHQNRRGNHRAGAAQAGGNLRKGHQTHTVGCREDGDVARAAQARVAAGDDRGFDRVHVHEPSA